MEDNYIDDDCETCQTEIEDLCSRFMQSPFFQKLTEEQKEYAEFIILSFGENMFDYYDQTIEEWEIDTLEECCCEILPKKVSCGDDYFKSVSPVLVEFFKFLEEQKVIANSAPYVEKLMTIKDKIFENSKDQSKWGMAKSIFMLGEELGFPMDTQEGINEFIDYYNARILADNYLDEDDTNNQPFVNTDKSLGRNDPCPCGSGKKYKKCCMGKK